MSGTASAHVIVPEAVNPLATNEKLSTPTTVPVEQKFATPREFDVALVEDDPDAPEIVASTRIPRTGVPLASRTSTGIHALCPTTPLTFDEDNCKEATFANGEVFAPPV